MGEITDAGEFVSNLNSRKWFNILYALVISSLIYIVYQQREQIKILSDSIHSNNDRYFDNNAAMELKLQDCNELRIKDADEINKYWRKRVEDLEADAYRGYKKLNQKR